MRSNWTVNLGPTKPGVGTFKTWSWRGVRVTFMVTQLTLSPGFDFPSFDEDGLSRRGRDAGSRNGWVESIQLQGVRASALRGQIFKYAARMAHLSLP